MLSFFRTNSAATLPLLLVYAFILRLTFSIVPQMSQPAAECAYLGSSWIAQWLRPAELPWLEHVVAALLLTVQAVLLSHITNKVRFAKQPSYLIGVFYLLAMHLLPEFATLSPVLLANTFVLLMLDQLIDVYKRKTADLGPVFNLGFFFGLAVILYPPYIWWSFFVIIGLFVVGRFEVKSLVLLLTALITQAIIVGTVVFWLPNWREVFMNRFLCHFQAPRFFEVGASGIKLVQTLALLAAVLVFLLIAWRHAVRKDMAVQKVITLVLWMAISGLLVVMAAHDVDFNRLLVWSLPLALLVGFWVSNMPTALAEFFHLGLFLFIVFYQIGRVMQVV